jgi:hypothetical protein
MATKKQTAQPVSEARIDNLTLARKEGWQRFVDTPARLQPERMTRRELDALSEDAFDAYNRERREWHANLGPIKTPQLANLHEDLWDIVDSNAQDGDKAKGAVAIDAFPDSGRPPRSWTSLGNTTNAKSKSRERPPAKDTSAGRYAESD